MDVAIDAIGNTYVTGLSTDGGDRDYVTIKYDASGSEIWVRRYDHGAGNDEARSIGLGPSGDVYVTGMSWNGADNDYATVKYDQAGNELWVARYDTGVGFDDESTAMAVDSGGYIYVTGYTGDTPTSEDYLTIKYDSGGNEVWARNYVGPGGRNDWARAIVVDSSGNAYVTGSRYGLSGYGYLTIKYDGLGNEIWTSRYDGPGGTFDDPQDIVLDLEGNVDHHGWSGSRLPNR